MTKNIKDSILVDGDVEATNFKGSGAQLTGIPQNAVLTNFNATAGGDITSTDTIQSGLQKVEYKIKNLTIPDSTFSNATPTPITIGGIPAGTTFSNDTMADMFNQLLYPYQYPSFSSFTISGQSTTLEVGATSNSNPSFSWSISNSSNVNTSSLSITDTTAGESLFTNISITSPASLTYTGVTKLSEGSEVYTISAVNTKNSVFTSTFTIHWKWALYYGESTTATPSEALVESLRIKSLTSSYASTYSFTSLVNGYKWFCYPSSFGTATTFKDTSTNLGVPFESPILVSVTNVYGRSTNYNCHRSTNALGGPISIMVS